MNNSDINRMDLIRALDVIFSAPSFSVAWELLFLGSQVELFFSPLTFQAFFVTGSSSSFDKYIELGCFYIASMKLTPDNEDLSESECRMYMKQKLITLLFDNSFMPWGNDDKFKRMFI